MLAITRIRFYLGAGRIMFRVPPAKPLAGKFVRAV